MRALQTISVLPPGDHRKKSLIFGGNPILSIENSKCRRRLCIIHKNLLKEKSAAGACKKK